MLTNSNWASIAQAFVPIALALVSLLLVQSVLSESELTKPTHTRKGLSPAKRKYLRSKRELFLWCKKTFGSDVFEKTAWILTHALLAAFLNLIISIVGLSH